MNTDDNMYLYKTDAFSLMIKSGYAANLKNVGQVYI